MDSALIFPDQAIQVQALAGDIVVPLSTKVYKWVPATLMLGGNPAMN